MVGALLVTAPAAAAAPLQGPATVGQWTGPYNWYTQLWATAFPHSECFLSNEIAHAALIPVGLQRGKVLLYNYVDFSTEPGCPDGTTRTWIFDPAAPTQLIVVGQKLDSNLFCGGQTWDPDGNLIVVGGYPIGGIGPAPAQSYRLRSRALNIVTPGVPPGSPPTINTSPWTPIGETAIGHYYPTALTLLRLTFESVCSGLLSSSGGGSFVLGGPPKITGVGVDVGAEVWEFLKRAGTSWSCALRPEEPAPAGYPYPSAYGGQIPPPALNTVTYKVKKTGDDSTYPEVRLDSYPRAEQITSGEIVIAGDIDTTSPASNTAGRTWILRPHYSGVSGWELWRGPDTQDRQWGSVCILNMWNPTLSPSVSNNRIFAVGGASGSPNLQTSKTVQEFEPGASPTTTGLWRPKIDLIHPRYYINVTVLPTGELFVHGGAEVADGSVLAFTPELYDPGRTPTSAQAAPIALEQPNPVGTPLSPIPRVYHHVAVLLPDGRVYVAGGANVNGYPNSNYTGEIYEPPYLHRGFRPIITQAPSSASFNAQGSSNTFNVITEITPGNTIERVVLLRPAAVTHHFDNDQRYIELAFTGYTVTTQPPLPVTAHLTITAPDETLGPPGWYMLFVIEKNATDGKLVPTVGEFIDLQ
jgi:hypothetical protein